MKKNRYTEEELDCLRETIKINAAFGRNELPEGTFTELYKLFDGRHPEKSICNTLSKLRKHVCESVNTLQEVTLKKETPAKETLTGEEPAIDIPKNGLGRLCRLSKEIETLAVMFNKAVKEFREEYDDNMELLKKMAKLRQAAADVSENIVKGGMK